MKMKRKSARRIPALLLTLVMLLSLMPTALAANNAECFNTECPSKKNPSTPSNITIRTITAATCHTAGQDEYTCSACHYTWKMDTSLNPGNHEYKYQDNGDGTHSGVCQYHSDAQKPNELHKIVNGRCAVCLAVDYDKVTISLPENPVVYVPLGSTDFGLTLGDVAMSIGSADITGDYNLTYSWYHQGTLVYTGDSYVLPASVTDK